MNPFANLFVFTTTMYRGLIDNEMARVRMARFLALAQNARDLGVNLVVVDGNSDQEFLDRVADFPNIRLLPEPAGGTMGSGRRYACGFAQAWAVEQGEKNPIFLWIEPEKADLITSSNLIALMEPIVASEADIVVPARNAAGIASMASFQAQVERICNAYSCQNLGLVYDLWFGPKMFNATAAAVFRAYNSEGNLPDKWDGIVIFPVLAVQGGLLVRGVEVEFLYDPSEKELEDKSIFLQFRRMLQASVIEQALRLSGAV